MTVTSHILVSKLCNAHVNGKLQFWSYHHIPRTFSSQLIKSVFKALKQKWGQLLHARLRKTRSALTKLEFATAISSDDIWEQSLTKTSIVNGFRK